MKGTRMQDSPTSIEVLEAARATLLEAILPVLPEERRLDAFMIANAIAMVARSIEFADEPERAEITRCEDVLGEAPTPMETTAELASRVLHLNRRLCAEIRQGGFDAPGEKRDALKRHLWETTLQKLRGSNPKHLKAAGLE
jgi:hypothetical protein